MLQVQSPHNALFKCQEHNPAAYAVNVQPWAESVLGRSILEPGTDRKETEILKKPCRSSSESKLPVSIASTTGKTSEENTITYAADESRLHSVSLFSSLL